MLVVTSQLRDKTDTKSRNSVETVCALSYIFSVMFASSHCCVRAGPDITRLGNVGKKRWALIELSYSGNK